MKSIIINRKENSTAFKCAMLDFRTLERADWYSPNTRNSAKNLQQRLS